MNESATIFKFHLSPGAGRPVKPALMATTINNGDGHH
jgi:hypothetical protein